MRKFKLKKRFGLFAILPIVGILSASIVYADATFGPARPTFTWASPATYVTFNSITNNPDTSIGDERYFVSARDAASSDHLTYYKTLNVGDGQDVVVRVYFHNDAAENLNLVAGNTRAKVTLPSTANTTSVVTGEISAGNANPAAVFATMDLKADKPFTVSYVPGSAQLWTQYATGVSLSDSIVGSGAPIGTAGPDGNVPGCSQYSGFVTLKVRVNYQPTPAPVSPVKPAATKPAALPNTGAGDVLGVFAGASAAGTAAHLAVTARRNRR